MIEVERSIVIARPAKEVFDFVGDIRNDPRWHTDVLEAKQVSGNGVAEGATFEARFKPFRGIDRGTVKIVRVDPDRAIELESVFGDMRPRLQFRLEPVAEGTRLTRAVQMELPGMMRLLSFMVRRDAARRNEKFLGNLKQVLEGGAAPEPPAP